MSSKLFSRYEVFVVAILSIIQFTIVLDFMVLSPLGTWVMADLNITTAQFGMVVSAYAFSAGASGLLAAGFADRFDRKKMLIFFYAGFILGTLFCALANDYHELLLARIVTGIFGGVIGSICFAIITDLFRMDVRGRVMGFVQMSFGASQVLGIPIGLYFTNLWGWNSPFMMIVVLCVVTLALILGWMKPIDTHLAVKSDRSAFQHLMKTLSRKSYVRAFAATIFLATGGFMLMPFASEFSVKNLGIDREHLFMLYFVTGIFSMATGPFIGKLSDTVGKYKVFVGGSVLSMIVVLIYCNLGTTPLWMVMIISVVMFAGVSSRIISASALMTAVPEPMDRGAFMSVNSSVQQISGGIATFVAGLIVVQVDGGKLQHYDILGYVVVAAMILTMAMLYTIHLYVTRRAASAPAAVNKAA